MPPAVTQERSAGCRLRCDPAQVSQARRLVRETLADWSLDDYIDHTVLISSKLVTNALRHGAGTISIRLYRARRDLRIDVHDHGTGRPGLQARRNRRRKRPGPGSDRRPHSHVQRPAGCTDDHTGPGMTAYVMLPIITNAVGAW
jgi:anti-sigma regulatory factor (Ser/Thr protein kinase)